MYGVLGNHDTIRMVPGLEEMGIRMLLNESETITLDGQRIHFAGIDDAHYYRADNIQNAASTIPHDEFSILLSHTPEIYRQAAHADFKLLLSGHTHGGQVCLPGSIPITLDAVLPRHMGCGPWKYHNMSGYTSVGVGSSIVAVRFNCPPEITLHHLQRPSSLPAALVGTIAKVEVVEQTGKKHFANKEDRNPRDNIQGRQRQYAPAGEKRKQRLRNLVESRCLSARREINAALQEAGKQVSRHGHARHQRSDFPVHAHNRGKCRRHQNRRKMPRNVFDEPSTGRPSTKLAPPSIGNAKWLPRMSFAITGVPFASVRRNKTFRVTSICIPALYRNIC